MENLRQDTINTYNFSARALAEYFRGIGPRVEDINLAFELADNPVDARVLEIGCGDGRDAHEIITRAGWYKGIDVSEGLLALARKKLPHADFEVADAVTFEYPEKLDIVFAFASLLHLDSNEVTSVLDKVHAALNPGGVFFISLKEKPGYTSEIKEDEYGRRLFFFYNAKIIQSLAGNKFQTVAHSRKTIGNTDWFEIALKKS
jgi:predicted TPR repeat methyltransferase